VISGSEKWDLPIVQRFPMSEEDAVSNLNQFFQRGFLRYEKDRNRADMVWSTSKPSAHLRIGTLSPNELYYKVENSDLSAYLSCRQKGRGEKKGGGILITPLSDIADREQQCLPDRSLLAVFLVMVQAANASKEQGAYLEFYFRKQWQS